MAKKLIGLSITLLCALSCAEDEPQQQETPIANVDCPNNAVVVEGRCVEDGEGCREVGIWQEVAAYRPEGFSGVEDAHVASDENGVFYGCVVGEQAGIRRAVLLEQLPGGDFEQWFIVDENKESLGCSALAVFGGRVFVLSAQPVALAVFDGQWRIYDLAGLADPEALVALRDDNAHIRLTPDRSGGVYIGISMGMMLDSQRLYLAHFDSQKGRVFTDVNGFAPNSGETRGYSPQHLMDEQGEVNVLFGNFASSDVLVTRGDVNPIKRFPGAHPTSTVHGDVITTLVLDRNGKMQLVEGRAGDDVGIFELGYRAVQTEEVPIWKIVQDGLGRTHILARAIENGFVQHLQVGDDNADVKTRLIRVGGAETVSPRVRELAIKTDLCGRPGMAVVADDENETRRQSFMKIFEMR